MFVITLPLPTRFGNAGDGIEAKPDGEIQNAPHSWTEQRHECGLQSGRAPRRDIVGVRIGREASRKIRPVAHTEGGRAGGEVNARPAGSKQTNSRAFGAAAAALAVGRGGLERAACRRRTVTTTAVEAAALTIASYDAGLDSSGRDRLGCVGVSATEDVEEEKVEEEGGW